MIFVREKEREKERKRGGKEGIKEEREQWKRKEEREGGREELRRKWGQEVAFPDIQGQMSKSHTYMWGIWFTLRAESFLGSGP